MELPDNRHHGGSFAVPVAHKRELFDFYNIDIATIKSDKPIDIKLYTLELQPGGTLGLVVRDQVINFRECTVSGRWQAIPYRGRLLHPDLSLRLIELETEGEDDIDELCERHRMVLVGCHPFSHYGGIPETRTAPVPPQSR